MRNFLLPFIIAACSKDTTEKPVSRSVTYERHYISDTRAVVDTSIHWCNVSGAELARFESYPHYAGVVCDSDPVIKMYLVIGEACKPGHVYTQAKMNVKPK